MPTAFDISSTVGLGMANSLETLLPKSQLLVPYEIDFVESK